MRNIILTGLPRSGTTLTCHLLNKVDDAVALHEPMSVDFSNKNSISEIIKEIQTFFKNSRDSILTEQTVVSVNVNGKVPDNTFGDKFDHTGLRINLEGRKLARIAIDKELTSDFTLCIKHNGVFTFLLRDLAEKFPCYAIVRNPLAVLASWNSVRLPVNDGHIPAAEKLDKALQAKLASLPDKLDRQLFILSWFFSHYQTALPKENIVYYEKMVRSGGSSLQIITPAAQHLSEALESRNRNALYDSALMKHIGHRLLESEGAYWGFYSRESVEDLLKQIGEPSS